MHEYWWYHVVSALRQPASAQTTSPAMLFNSIEFLFLFLPTVLAVFLLLQRAHRNRLAIAWLTLSSLFFYAWWNPVYLLLILTSMGANYHLGRQMPRRSDRAAQWLLVAGVCFNLGLLAYFKYFNFFISSINTAIGGDLHFEAVVLPLAISFFTFQQITYLVDCRKGLTTSHSLLDYSLFVAFFPQLIAGPIVHHGEMLAQFRQLQQSRAIARNLAVGGSILAIGLFKKVVIADSFAQFATPVYTLVAGGEVLNSVDIVAGVFAYAFQLYFDFSGYSDMAIGLACLFGIKLPVNFFSPYRARNIGDFWRMWHATLSRFLRDYVYTPLGGFVCSPNRQRFNLFTTMFLGGVWHGAGWTFIVYGLLHGSFVVIHQLWRVRVSGPLGWVTNPGYQAVAQMFTFLVVVFSLVFFRADSLATATAVLGQLGNLDGAGLSNLYQQQLRDTNLMEVALALPLPLDATGTVFGLLFTALLVCWFLPSTHQLFEAQRVALGNPRVGRPPRIVLRWAPDWRWASITALLLIASFLNLTEVSEFLYFQF